MRRCTSEKGEGKRQRTNFPLLAGENRLPGRRLMGNADVAMSDVNEISVRDVTRHRPVQPTYQPTSLSLRPTTNVRTV